MQNAVSFSCHLKVSPALEFHQLADFPYELQKGTFCGSDWKKMANGKYGNLMEAPGILYISYILSFLFIDFIVYYFIYFYSFGYLVPTHGLRSPWFGCPGVGNHGGIMGWPVQNPLG